MSDPEQRGERLSSTGHHYQGVHVGPGAKAHVGDTYNISRENPLSLLPFAANAPFNSYDRQHEPTCLPNTRVDVLQKISQWADDEDQQCLFWLSGMAGTGKSTIAHTVARRYFEEGRLAASFFFSRGSGDVGNAGKFVTTIAVQLAMHIPPVQRHIRDILTERSIITSLSLADQWRQLVLGPLSKLDNSDTYPSYVAVIDALDECEGEKYVRTIIQLLPEARSLKKVRLRVLITSRPEVPIRYGFCQVPDAEHHDFVLHDIEAAIVDHDISIFLGYELRSIGQEQALEASWPGEQALRRLVLNASGLFIWAATACRFIREGRRYAANRLSMMLDGSTTASAPEHQLSKIYITVLKNSVRDEYLEAEKEDMYTLLRQLLGTIVALYSPLSVNSLCELLYLPKVDIEQGLADLHAVLDIPADANQPLRLHHPSFRDFLINKERCSNLDFSSPFWVDENEMHLQIATRCIQLMSSPGKLKQNICNLPNPGILQCDVSAQTISDCLPKEVQYACRYWVDYLKHGNGRIRDRGDAYAFLLRFFLYWLEAMSWFGLMTESIHIIYKLQSLLEPGESVEASRFLYDAARFILTNRFVIETAPLQTYCSAIAFAPEDSIVRKKFISSIPKWITQLPRVQKDWGAALQTLEGHTGSVRAVTFSPDGKQVASASDDRTVRLWDAAKGTALQTLKGHTKLVKTVTFSPDGKQVASASRDRTVRLWDAAKGTALQTLKGHTGSVNTVTFSLDGKQIASASHDRTVRLWDAATGAALQSIKGSRDIHTLSFSIDGSYLQTDRGSFQLHSHTGGVLSQSAHSSELLVRDGWITRGNVNLLWLPREYRASVAAVFGDAIVIGHPSGRVSMFEFSF